VIDASAPATSADETPAFIRAGDDTVFAMLTRPTTAPNGFGVVLVPGGGLGGSAMQNRLWVALARDLAADGFHVVRHDYRGVGDSSGTVLRFLVGEPFIAETAGAADWLAREGVDRLILVGACYGSRAALAAAARLPNVEALAMVSCPVSDNERGENAGMTVVTQGSLGRNIKKAAQVRVVRHLFDAERRRHYRHFARVGLRAAFRRMGRRLGLRTLPPNDIVSPALVRELETLVTRGTKLFFLFGRQESDYRSFEVAADRLPIPRHDPTGQTKILVLDDESYLFNTIKAQQATVSALAPWLKSFATSSSTNR
jgi:pimeloyl-ACP methyl ester carboxylesterase